MGKRRVLLICGSLNQTTMMHKVGSALGPRYRCSYSPFYCDGVLLGFKKIGLLEHTVLGGRFREITLRYLRHNKLPVDEGGVADGYDLVVTCSDLILQRNIRGKKIVLVQEGMTDPENFAYRLVRRFPLPRWLASTSTAGLSLAYSRFCVASAGYLDLFAARGIPRELIAVTGIPNFDNCVEYLDNDFAYRNYVLVATSDTRETFKFDNRRRFLERAKSIAAGRQLIFKCHPNEDWDRTSREIRTLVPDALIFCDGNAEQMVANCDVLITQYSTLAFVGIALGKECHSYFDMEQLRHLVPWQNGGTSARRIADVCEEVIEREMLRERMTA
ncbi:MAG TPA: hypothetical protein VMT45_13255 [Thermoanaerobaculaceae bacterium]|nr:hypothetical protein [Thermoanaerobaculaceae bacterium]